MPPNFPVYTGEIGEQERAGLKRILMRDGLSDELAAQCVEIFALAKPDTVWAAIVLWVSTRDLATSK